jgi:AcrR family transcriptional regulator
MTEIADPPNQRPKRIRARQSQKRAMRDDRGRQARGDRRRQQILDAAVELFAAKGFRGTGVAALGDRVGMTATGMLYYFGSKKRLLQEVVAERDRQDGIDLKTLRLSDFRMVGHYNADTALLTRLYVVLGAESLDPDDPLHDFFVDRYEMGRELVRSILMHERDEGLLRADIDCEQIAKEVIATIMGLEIQWLTDPDRVELGQTIVAYLDRLISELSV